MKNFYALCLLLLLFNVSSIMAAEPDSVIFTNGNFIVGEVKSMERGVMKMETPFSDSDRVYAFASASALSASRSKTISGCWAFSAIRVSISARSMFPVSISMGTPDCPKDAAGNEAAAHARYG